MNYTRYTSDESHVMTAHDPTSDHTISPNEAEGVIYALHIARNAIGAVFYDGGSRTLSIMEDVPQTELKSDIEQCYQVKELPSRYFCIAKGKVAMEDLVASHHQEGMRQNTLGAIPVEEGQSLACTNAILSYIRQRSDPDATDPYLYNQTLPLVLEIFSMKNIMKISNGVLQRDSHPSVHQPKVRGGFSLFGIMNYTLTAMGAKKLRQWFCLPTYDIDILEERQNAVAYFIEAENLLIRDQFRACLKLMNNVEFTVGRMKTSSNLSDWRHLLRFAIGAKKLHYLAQNVTVDLEVVRKITSAIDLRVLEATAISIENTIDFTNSQKEGTIVIRSGIDDWLDETKKAYWELGDLLVCIPASQRQVAEEINSTVPSFIADVLDVVYLPQLGYLITLPKKIDPSSLHSDEFQFQFSAEDTNYYKNSNTRGDVLSMLLSLP
ncbi:hypothetical protein K450DRAFT_274164 [Umbelopsis ramanniana AG]|uniref:DNA mismatch repair protein MutS core domain-containing protein n=1 Tax=Umbelopsis ramanniana AG TaxID=1314678 RepID=A0AAD5HBY7_UMBRA|nr:uncharacterized protein K450DRAFT_274164 [Umbelopsis ramanniana AG]KAI8576991.1 hypothetical protein K450DRAFT_274164 [Umbelopsis ramanniana AG]